MIADGKKLWASVAVVSVVALTTALAQQPSVTPELDQGWSPSEREAWYEASQGSRLMPLSWFQYLETKDGGGFFAAWENLSRFGYLQRPGADADDLPIGFAEDVQSDKNLSRTKLRWKARQGDKAPWLGLTCSACHTGAVEFGGKALLVDGGQGMSDFQSFMEALNAALEDTRQDANKWRRFAGRVLPQGEADDNLKTAFDALLAWQRKEAAQNDTPLRYGPTRIDAIGHIFNKVALTLDYDHATKNPADAPVSIPFIWRAPQLKSVQYDGLVDKKMVGDIDFGALGRNAGEVIGVFGDVVAHTDPSLVDGFTSSVDVQHLIGLETTLAELRPPKWPSSLLGTPDPQLVAKGEQAFNDHHCNSCHQPIDRTDLNASIDTPRFTIGGKSSPDTDPWMACNAEAYSSSTGVLNGLKSKAVTDDVALGAQAKLVSLLQATVKATLFARKGDIALAAVDKLFNIPLLRFQTMSAVVVMGRAISSRRSPQKTRQLASCKGSELFGYTTRPLNGVWATAPYLHNGSVPTLYDLLLPPDQRPVDFYVGARLYDPKHMGYDTKKETPGNTFHFVARDDQGPIDGNSNSGHDYGNAQLTDDDRYSIIEYLKTQ